MSGDLVQVQTTLPTAESAADLARRLLSARLAACVQTAPVRSMYHWQGKLEDATETALSAKTRASLAAPLMDFIRQHHPYQVPEILALPVLDSLPAYRDWVYAETGEKP